MAKYESSTFNNASGGAGSQALAINKPTGLAVGDLMVAQVMTAFAGGAGVPATGPAGWTVLRTDGTARVYWKLADSADVAATSFTFTLALVNSIHGYISRFSSVNPNLPIDQNNGNYQQSGGTGAISSSGITPTVLSSLYVISVMGNDVSSRTVSGQQIVTSNPTWTEAFDAYRSLVTISLAYAPRGQLTSTGNASATFSGATEDRTIQIFNINSVVEAPLIALAPPVINTVFINIMVETFGVVPAILTPIVRGITNAWDNVSKNASSWINRDKS